MAIVIECRSLSKRFVNNGEEFRALSHVNLKIQENAFIALVGPSGCGKTTLLHILSGLDTDFDGELISTISRQQIAYVFQNPRLLPWLTAQENLTFILQARGESKRQANEIARHYLELVGLSGFENKFPSQLSGGMRQRVALARALMVEPKLMLMDEPFGSLDELTARRLRLELLRLFEQIKKTVVFVTHNVTEAIFLADLIVVMGTRPGRIIAELLVNLSRPRDYDSPEIAEIAKHIVGQLQI